MITKDEELYHACIRFCQAYGHFLFRKVEYDNYKLMGCCDKDEMEQVMDFEWNRLKGSFVNLKEKIKEIEDIE